ncbi:hypothetical protein MMC21_004270 [Puttea exsequens]|nr:hypothetical protein [Puttea exsequens]
MLLKTSSLATIFSIRNAISNIFSAQLRTVDFEPNTLEGFNYNSAKLMDQSSLSNKQGSLYSFSPQLKSEFQSLSSDAAYLFERLGCALANPSPCCLHLLYMSKLLGRHLATENIICQIRSLEHKTKMQTAEFQQFWASLPMAAVQALKSEDSFKELEDLVRDAEECKAVSAGLAAKVDSIA